MSKRKNVTVRDVAKACGVSVYTVSSVLNNKGDISEKTTRKVLKTIHRLNYDPLKNIPLIRGLTAKTLGLVLPGIYTQNNPFYFRAIHTAQTTISEMKGHVKLLGEKDLYAVLSKNRSDIMDLGCDSILLFCPNGPWEPAVKQLLHRGVPVGLVRREFRHRGVILAVDDDYQGVLKAMQHLHKDHGFQQIALLSMAKYLRASNSRLDAYRDYIRQHGLSDNPLLLIADDIDEPLEERIEKLYRKQFLQAILCMNDDVAARTAKIILQMGLRIPEDLAVVGVNNDPGAQQFHPGITSVNIPVEEMVAAACQSLFNYTPAMSKAVTRMEFETSLVIRESCGCKLPETQGGIKKPPI